MGVNIVNEFVLRFKADILVAYLCRMLLRSIVGLYGVSLEIKTTEGFVEVDSSKIVFGYKED